MSLGKLYIVATPIGNMDDMSQRAIDTLQQVDMIAAEDTRDSGKLLGHYGIKTATLSYHEHNEQKRSHDIEQLLQQGRSVALISDAGTPLISDPGFILVRQLRQKGYDIVPVPGCCAVIAALSVSGLPTDSFAFHGFLPSKSGARRAKLQQVSSSTTTLIFYESTHRIKACLQDIHDVIGTRSVVLARELSKTFETVLSGSAQSLLQQLQQDRNQCKGEFVLMMEGDKSTQQSLNEEQTAWLKQLLKHVSVSEASKITAKITGLKRNEVYTIAQQLKSNNDDAD